MSNYKDAYQYRDPKYKDKFYRAYQQPKPTAGGALIQEAREYLGITRSELGRLMGFMYRTSGSRITYWELGKHPIPMKHVHKLAKFLKLDAELLAQAIMQDSMGARRYRTYVNPSAAIPDEEDLE